MEERYKSKIKENIIRKEGMIDLHIHTKCSDGRLGAYEILQKSYSEGIDTISFCDHNVVKDYHHLMKLLMKFIVVVAKCFWLILLIIKILIPLNL